MVRHGPSELDVGVVYHLGAEMSNEKLEIVLENLVDRHGLEVVLDQLTMVCVEKSAHLRSMWQDSSGAKWWTIMAKRIEKVVR